MIIIYSKKIVSFLHTVEGVIIPEVAVKFKPREDEEVVVRGIVPSLDNWKIR